MELTKDEFRHIAALFLVYLDWYTVSVIPNRNSVVLGINVNFDQVHGVVSLEVVSGIDQNLV